MPKDVIEVADVLIVDDDPDVAEAFSEVLKAEGHQPRVAYNGREGLNQLERSIPDLVLLDVDMPVLSGPEMAYAMFVHDVGLDRIPIILVSGVPDLRERAVQVGTPYALAKPFRYEQLAGIIESALRQRVAPRPLLPGAQEH